MPQFQSTLNVETKSHLHAGIEDVFTTYFRGCFYADGSHKFIDYVIPPCEAHSYSIVVIIYGIAPPNGYVEWRFPMYKDVSYKILVVDGNEYKCSIGTTITN